MNHQALSSFIWSVADLLRGDYKQSEYGRVILPFTVLRRLACVLAQFNAKTQGRLEPQTLPVAKALRMDAWTLYSVGDSAARRTGAID
jgi:type I restriction enzyme M protein